MREAKRMTESKGKKREREVVRIIEKRRGGDRTKGGNKCEKERGKRMRVRKSGRERR